jgi:hypothetical protein
MRCVTRCFCSTEDIPDIPSNFRIPCHNMIIHTHTHTHKHTHTHTYTSNKQQAFDLADLAHDAIFLQLLPSIQLTKMTSPSTRWQSKPVFGEADVIVRCCLQSHCRMIDSYIGVLFEATARSDGIVLPFSAQ